MSEGKYVSRMNKIYNNERGGRYYSFFYKTRYGRQSTSSEKLKRGGTHQDRRRGISIGKEIDTTLLQSMNDIYYFIKCQLQKNGMWERKIKD